jgi:hypothetical protein
LNERIEILNLLRGESDLKYVCFLCGYPDLRNNPWSEDGLSPSYDICPCCGMEYGVDDINELAFKLYREEWFSKGRKWFDQQVKPPLNWDLSNQVENINKIRRNNLPYYLR